MKKYLLPIVRLYWKVFQPRTFGVKVLILHPVKQNEFLVVRHSYGNKQIWNLPGGGYNPKKENVLQAGIREVKEELGVLLVEPRIIGHYFTTRQGKRDSVTFVTGTISDIKSLKKSYEITDFDWFRIDNVPNSSEVSTIIKEAVKALIG